MSGIILAEGVIEVTADASDVPRDIAKDVENGSGATTAAGMGMGKKIFGGIVGAWAAIGATQKIGDFFTGAITGSSDLNETLSKSSAIFGDQASAIEAFGNSAAKNVGLSKEAAISAAAGFGDMFTQLGFAGDAAAAMSQQVVIAAADLGSFSNLDTADVAERISAAFRGEYDSLQQVIPNINAARVESEALAMTGKKVASELTAQEKATAVLAIVQQDGARAMGDFARTSEGAANKQKILTASFEDQQTKLGTVLLPLWTGFLGFLTDTAIPVLSAVVGWISQNAEWLAPLAAGLGIATAAVWAFNVALNANPIMLIITAIGALVGGILWVATQTTFFQDVWTNVTTAIGTAWQWLWDTILNPVFTAIGEAFNWIYNNVISPIVTGIMVYVGLWAAIIQWLWESVISPVIGAIGQAFNWIYANVIAPVVAYIQAGIQAWGAVFQWLYTAVISPVMSAVGTAFNWVWNSVISPVARFITGAITNIGNTVRSVFGGIGSFIGSAFQAALSVVRGPINGIIGLVNSAIRGLNSLRVTIPDWVPMVGGQTWGVSIPTIPMLAKGGVIRSGGTVLVGERGPEFLTLPTGAQVTPLSRAGDVPGSSGGDTYDVDITVNEAEDPLGSAARIAKEFRKFGRK